MCLLLYFFFFNDPATTEIYTLSLHDALPIWPPKRSPPPSPPTHPSSSTSPAAPSTTSGSTPSRGTADRKSTRLNSSHANISYAVFCLKKKKYRLSKLRIRRAMQYNVIHKYSS